MLFPGTKAERVDSDVVSTTPLHAESDLKKEEVEKPMPFEKASWSALGKLKRMIEKKEKVEVVRQMLRENPRLIINSSGFVIPTIMHQGCLYQPMHIAAKAGNLDVCRLLLNCSEFMALLYPGDEKDLNETVCYWLPSFFLFSSILFAICSGVTICAVASSIGRTNSAKHLCSLLSKGGTSTLPNYCCCNLSVKET